MQRVIAVTGATGGVGAELARAFGRDHHRLALLTHVEVDKAEALAKDIRAQGGEAISVLCDVREPKMVEAAFAEARERLGEVDVLVNSAGTTRDALVERMTEEAWMEVVDVHLNGTFRCTRAVLPGMVSRRFGRVINVSSVVASTGAVGATNYAAAKAGIEGFTRSLAKEVARHGVTVNAVALGYLTLGMGARLRPDFREKVEGMIPLRRFGSPQELVPLFRLLASDASSYITGSVLRVDGGFA